MLFILAILFVACNVPAPKVSEESKKDTQQRMVEVNRLLIAKDKKRIEGYIERMGYTMQESNTGLWYEIIEYGEGDSIRSGDGVELKYKISLLDGTPCYNSDTDGIKSFRVGRGGVEAGLEQGILLMAYGGKARFILPPHLAHGLPGDGARIPARAIIIYELEVLSFN